VRAAAVALAILVAADCGPAAGAGAAAIIHPRRKPVASAPSLPHRDLVVRGERGARIRGWLFPARGPSRGLVVYLHGLADNRGSGVGLAERYVPRGYDVLLYDARAHGASSGNACTWGVLEKRDLSRLLDAVGATRVALVGVSMGAGVAIQAAAQDRRVVAVVAAAPFASLAALAREHAPAVAPNGAVRRALALAEAGGAFRIADASPEAAAARVRAPVLLVHGGRDDVVPPHHSREILANLAGPRRRLVVPEAGHDDALGHVWAEVDAWIEAALPPSGVLEGRAGGVRAP
jgi:pimeloyl-ACP methyl ester carboxylesterase